MCINCHFFIINNNYATKIFILIVIKTQLIKFNIVILLKGKKKTNYKKHNKYEVDINI